MPPTTFTFSPSQLQAASLLDAWLQSPGSQTFSLFGAAGTGKTTILAHILAQYPDLSPLTVSLTGRAVARLRETGTTAALTIHSAFYRTFAVEDAKTRRESIRFSFNPKSENALAAGIFIIDECSMVDERLARDILSFQKPVILLGDPFQLPPVFGNSPFVLTPPQVVLTEIHRQAADNPIIALSAAIRSDIWPSCTPPNSDPRLRVMPSLMHSDPLTSYSLIICGRNNTRRSLNTQYRRLSLRTSTPPTYPVPGERLICLRNNHNTGLLNGVLYTCLECTPPTSSSATSFALTVQAADESDPPIELQAHTSYFLTGESPTFDLARTAEHFDYGYAMTCHKVQGCESPNVLVYDESSCFRERNRWLYTAVTRASQSLTLLL